MTRRSIDGRYGRYGKVIAHPIVALTILEMVRQVWDKVAVRLHRRAAVSLCLLRGGRSTGEVATVLHMAAIPPRHGLVLVLLSRSRRVATAANSARLCGAITRRRTTPERVAIGTITKESGLPSHASSLPVKAALINWLEGRFKRVGLIRS